MIAGQSRSHDEARIKMRTGDVGAYRENDDLIKSIRWLATLDTSTRPECRIRDGKQYSLDSHEPIGHEVPWRGGPGKVLERCRCIALPVLRSWRELGIGVDEMPSGSRASMGGQVPANLYYPQWIETQSLDIQERALGRDRARLLRFGGLSYAALHADDGTYLDLGELRQRHVLAFVLAGLH